MQGEWIELDETAFYPGGGGQEADAGTIGGLPVAEVKSKGAVLHRVPDHRFEVDQTVECEVDWNRRYDLMKGHSGEHLLFSALSKRVPGLELVKIAVTPTKKSVVVKGAVTWSTIAEVQGEVNDLISSGLEISERWVSRDDPGIEAVRAKLDRIHGERVRIVSIGEIDRAACAGIHVRSTREIGALLITRLTSARPSGDWEIEFEVDERAIRSALEIASAGLRASDVLGSNPQDLISSLVNLKRESESLRDSVKWLGRKMLRELVPQSEDGIDIYSGTFVGIGKKELIDAANSMIERGRSCCILMAKDDKLLLLVACSPGLRIDCSDIVSKAMRRAGGKGGGQRHFAMGGAGATDMADEIFEEALELVRAEIKGRAGQ